MIKMIVADDELLIIRGLKKLLDWETMNIEIIGEYTDGRQALNGILALQPEIALLDISMPELSGIEVLRELNRLQAGTKVIFISGFQDFEYAKQAVNLGARAYLLKPIIREELLKALVSCLPETEQAPAAQELSHYENLLEMERCCYTVLLMQPLFDETDAQMQRLICFSMQESLEQMLENEKLGIIFQKNENTVVVLKKLDRKEAIEKAIALEKELFSETGVHCCFIVGEQTEQMNQIRDLYENCIRYAAVCAFALYMQQYVFDIRTIAKTEKKESMEAMIRQRELLYDRLIFQREEAFMQEFQLFCKYVARASEYVEDQACYLLCSGLRHFYEQLKESGIVYREQDVNHLFEKGRLSRDYREMTAVFQDAYIELFQQLANKAISHTKTDIKKATDFIEQNFTEALTLERLAEHMHMNAFYFSSYFKKHTGVGFKEYLGKVRLKHALLMLAATDKMAYEIAEACGFSDARAFSELFQKYYKEKPSEYRKRIRENGPGKNES